jgi:hypothetical protein
VWVKVRAVERVTKQPGFCVGDAWPQSLKVRVASL